MIGIVQASAQDYNHTSVEHANGRCMTIGCSFEQFVHGFAAYESGALIQEAFSFLTADEREFMMTGMTPEEWSELFSEEE